MGYLTRSTPYQSLHSPAQHDDEREAIRQRNAELGGSCKRQLKRGIYVGPLTSFSGKTRPISAASNAHDHSKNTMAQADDEDISRPPEASSDDENEADVITTTQHISQPKNAAQACSEKSSHFTSPPRTRTKKRRIQNETTHNAPPAESSSQNVLNVLSDDWVSSSLSQGKQSRKRGIKYSSQQSKEETFKVPSASPQTPKHKSVGPIYKYSETPKKVPSQSPARFKAGSDSPFKLSSPQQLKKFQLLTSDQVNGESNQSIITDEPSIDELLESPHDSDRPRRESSSSLSSTGSIADYLFGEDEEAQFLGAASDSVLDFRRQVRCPMCRRITDRRGLEFFEEPSKMSLRKQQKFCQKHRFRDAEEAWQNAQYPKISWDEILKVRLPGHKDDLLKFARREVSSYYLEVLDSRLRAAKGNQSRYNKYFESEMMDVVKHGYYGPRGAKLLSSAIAGIDELTTAIAHQSRYDKTVKLTSLVRLIDAFLLPELMVMLVMEDMSIEDPAEARKVLDESSEMGLLLQPDNDHIQTQLNDS